MAARAPGPTSRSSAAGSSARRSPPSSPGAAPASSCTSGRRSPRARRAATPASSGTRPTRSSARCTARRSPRYRALADEVRAELPAGGARSATSASPTQPAGILASAGTQAWLRAQRRGDRAAPTPTSAPTFVDGRTTSRRLEPGLADGLVGRPPGHRLPGRARPPRRARSPPLARAARRRRSAWAWRRGPSRATGGRAVGVDTGGRRRSRAGRRGRRRRAVDARRSSTRPAPGGRSSRSGA